MGISIDAGKVEDLRKLSAFFEFISNPQAYKEFLAETKAVLGGMDKTIAAHTTVEKAEEYLALAQKKVAEVNLAVEEHNRKMEQEAAAAKAKSNEMRAANETEEARLDGVRRELAAERMAQEEHQKTLSELARTLNGRETALVAKETQYAVRLRALEDKQAKLTKLLEN